MCNWEGGGKSSFDPESKSDKNQIFLRRVEGGGSKLTPQLFVLSPNLLKRNFPMSSGGEGGRWLVSRLPNFLS